MTSGSGEKWTCFCLRVIAIFVASEVDVVDTCTFRELDEKIIENKSSPVQSTL